MDPTKNTACIVKEECLLVRYLAMDVLLPRARVAEMCLPSRCLAVGIHVTVCSSEIPGSLRMQQTILFIVIAVTASGATEHTDVSILSCPTFCISY
jgi:hypothetical protein